MAKLEIPRVVISIPRVITVLAVAGVVIYGAQVAKASLQSQPIRTQTVSVKNSIPYTAAPQAVSQPAPVQTPKTETTVPQAVAVVKVTHSSAPAPIVTPAPTASVSGLAPVSPTTPASSSGSTSTPSSTSGTGSSSSGSSASTPTTSSYTSENWSGYMMASAAAKYISMSGSWIVPKATGVGGETTADAAWIGIGGVSTGDLIQVGTQDTVSANGTETSSAFYELLPHPSKTISSMAVAPGDTVEASLAETATNEWRVTIADTTNGRSFTTDVAYDSQLSSAEWIEEDPSYSASRLVPLDNFSPITFTDATAIENGNTVNLASGNAEPITLITSPNTVVASPSSLGSDDESFTITKQS